MDSPRRGYLYSQGFCRATTVPYYTASRAGGAGGGAVGDLAALDVLAAHITNNCFQVNNAGFSSKEVGNIFSLRQLQVHLDTLGGGGGGGSSGYSGDGVRGPLSVDEHLWPQWRELAKGVAGAGANTVWDAVRSRAVAPPAQGAAALRCFEVFGLDVLVDEDGRSWLLEVNTNPGLYDFGNTWCAAMLDGMLQGLRALAIDPLFEPGQGVCEVDQGKVTEPDASGAWELIWSSA